MDRQKLVRTYRRALRYPWMAYGVFPAIRKVMLLRSKWQKKGRMAPTVENMAASGQKVTPDLEARTDFFPPSGATTEQVAEYVWNGPRIIRQFFEATARGSVARGKMYVGSLYGCYRLTMPPTFAATIEGGRIDAKTGFLMDRKGQILIESNVSRLEEMDRYRLADVVHEPHQTLEGAIVSLVHPWASNYAHWLLDFLPRVILAERLGFAGRYALLEKRPGFNAASLGCLGIPPERIVDLGHPFGQAERLFVPVTARGTLMPRPEYVAEIRKRSHASVGMTDAAPSRRLYISRKAAERAIVNEAELLPILEKRGFEILQPETMTFEQQVAAFAEAEILAGPHGAGMYNGMFMQPGSMVLEIMNVVRWELSAQRLARLLDVEHWHIHAENRDFADWKTYVNSKEFELSLDRAIEFQAWSRQRRKG